MSHLSEKEQNALHTFKEQLHKAFPDNIESIHLFGSKVRGDAHPDSDVDVLVIADLTRPDRDRIVNIATEIFLETEVDISPKVYSKARFRQMRERKNMFWQSIEPDLTSL